MFPQNNIPNSHEVTLSQFLGYGENNSNVTIIDLSGVPFEVLSITVSLISRLLFEFGYYYTRLRHSIDQTERINNNTPFLLVYEEAHKYVPNSDLAKYRASKESIERIAKEYPTPFHIYDEKGIRENARKLKKAFSWNKGFKEYFAVKATPNPQILKILQRLKFLY